MEFIVLGDGGHSRVVREMIDNELGSKVFAVLDDKYNFVGERKGIILGPISYVHQLLKADRKVVIAIGNNQIRKNLQNKLNIHQNQFATIIHYSAMVSPTAIIRHGTVVMPGVYINAGVTIHEHCIINTGAIVEHDTQIDAFAHISPNVTLTGNVSIGKGAHVGASSTVIPGKRVGSWSTIGAGSTVIKDIPSQCTAVGSPTRIVSGQIKKNMEIRW